MNRKIIFTKAGLEKLRKDYENLTQKRALAVAELARARDMGDRSENAAYKSARFNLSRIDSRLRYFKKTLDHAVVAAAPSKDTIGIGSKVSLSESGKTHIFEIVGDHESDLSHGKISQRSPLGRALMGKKVGEEVIIHVPVGKIHYKVEKIF